MLYHEKELFEKDGKRTLLLCGPQVFKEASAAHPSPFIWAIVSKSMTEKPEVFSQLQMY